MILFLRTAERVAADGLESIQVDEGSTFQSGMQRMDAAFAVLQHSLADALDAKDLVPEERKAGQALKSVCKELAEECRIIAENYANALDREQARQDTSKLEFRGQLQTSLSRFATAVGQLDDELTKTVKAWGIEADKGATAPDTVVPAQPIIRQEKPAASMQPPVVAPTPVAQQIPPVAPPPQLIPIDPADWRVWVWSPKQKRWNEFPLNKMTVQTEDGALRARNTAKKHWKRSILLYRSAVVRSDFDVTFEFRASIESFDLQSEVGEDAFIGCAVPQVSNQWHTARFTRRKRELFATVDDVPAKVVVKNANELLAGFLCLKLHPDDAVEIRNLKIMQGR